MEQSIIKNNTQWKDFYRTAGTMALLIAIAGLVDAITSNMGVGATDNTSLSVIEWFALFQTNGFAAFSRLGVINIITKHAKETQGAYVTAGGGDHDRIVDGVRHGSQIGDGTQGYQIEVFLLR